MKIYTKTGDEGETGLFGGPRVRKDDPRIEAYGTVDELNAWLGVARCESLSAAVERGVARVQSELFDLGAELATPRPADFGLNVIGATQIEALEREIDTFEAELAPLKQFILPGGTRGAAALHGGRTVARRAERQLVSLAAREPISPALVIYLNRLSDWLFVAARAENHAAGVPDVPWQRGSN